MPAMLADLALPLARRVFGTLAALLVVAAAQAASPASPRAAGKQEDCCVDRLRTYTAKPTAKVLALWAAAQARDEREFMRLLPEIDKVADYAVDDVPLLAAMLRPRETAKNRTYGDMSKEETARWLDIHRRSAPAVTRMVAAALQRGAGTADITVRSPQPPLHLALLFATPDTVRVLLAAGARPDQIELRDNRTALEFMLKQEFAVRMSHLPPLVSRAERSDMVMQLLQAGASRPFKSSDKALAKEGYARPAADYLAWEPLVTLTEGGEVVRALAGTGTRPAIDPEEDREPTVLAVAAATGNAGALEAILALVPEAATSGANGWNAQLDAALAAAATGRLALAKSLAKAGMPFAQVGPRRLDGGEIRYERIAVDTGTLLQFAVRAGDAPWIRQLVAWKAPADGGRDDYARLPLTDALAAKRPEIVDLLLELGANPVRRTSGADDKAPLVRAISEGRSDVVKAMLARVDGPRKAQLAALSGDIARAWAESDDFAMPSRSAALKSWLDAAGFAPAKVSAAVLSSLIGLHGSEVARLLIAGGAPVELGGDNAIAVSPLATAIQRSDVPTMNALLARGASPSGPSAGGTPIQLALQRGDSALVERLFAAGPSPKQRSPAGETALDLVVLSGNLALVDKMSAAAGTTLDTACPSRDGDAGLLLRDEAYFNALVARGLSFTLACPGQPPLRDRIYQSLLADDRPLLTARRAAVTRMLKRAGPAPGGDIRIGAEPLRLLPAAIAAQRLDLAMAFVDAGVPAATPASGGVAPAWLAIESGQPELLRALLARGAPATEKTPQGLTLADHLRCRESEAFRRRAGLSATTTASAPCPTEAPMTATEQSRAKLLAGHYYLANVREVGSEIVLKPGGEFAYMLSYGAVDEQAAGRWRVAGSSVVLSSKPQDAGEPIRLLKAARDSALDGVAMRWRVGDKPVAGLEVIVGTAVMEVAAPYAPAADGYGRVPTLKQADSLAVRHPKIDGGRWFFFELPNDSDGRPANRLDFAIDADAGRHVRPFAARLEIDGAALVMSGRGSRPMRYERQ